MASQNEKLDTFKSNASVCKILVLDNEPEIVDLLCAFLNSENICTKGITSPKDVDDAMATFKPDVLFTDISMPTLTGFQLLEKVSKSHPHMPVVFISGHVNKHFLLDVASSGVFAVIEKPFDIEKAVECGFSAIQKSKLEKVSGF